MRARLFVAFAFFRDLRVSTHRGSESLMTLKKRRFQRTKWGAGEADMGQCPIDILPKMVYNNPECQMPTPGLRLCVHPPKYATRPNR